MPPQGSYIQSIMSKNIFINNLDTYVSDAIFKELRNDDVDEEGNPNPDAHRIFGTYITKDSSTNPDGVKKMLKVSFSLILGSYMLEGALGKTLKV